MLAVTGVSLTPVRQPVEHVWVSVQFLPCAAQVVGVQALGGGGGGAPPFANRTSGCTSIALGLSAPRSCTPGAVCAGGAPATGPGLAIPTIPQAIATMSSKGQKRRGVIVCSSSERGVCGWRPPSPPAGDHVDGDQCDHDSVEGEERGSSGREDSLQVEHGRSPPRTSGP